MYASIRQYRARDTEELLRRVRHSFVPVVRKVPGFSDHYIIDSGDGVFTTVTVAHDEAGVEQSVTRAREWVRDNAADLVEGPPTVTSGEVVVHTRLRPSVV